MPRVIFKRVLEALSGNTSSSSSGGNSSNHIEPNFSSDLSTDQFQPYKIARHGFPYRPTALAYDPVQKLLAIGTYTGTIRILGQRGVDRYIAHETDKPVIKLIFLNNQGALVSVCADDTIHLWNLRQTQPAILHSLKFNRERVTCTYIPHGSKWLYIGTDKGNVHLCHVESFTLSGYSISWNKAIELSQKSHPGQVIEIAENPCNESRIIIVFQCGTFVLWDLKQKEALQRYYCNNTIHHVCWHHEGKQFMCSHNDGIISLWSVSNKDKPISFQRPHGKESSGSISYHAIEKVDWLSCTDAESLVIFSGGLAEEADTQPTITVMQGKSITVLEMGSPVVDFVAVSHTPWKCDNQDPTDLVILLNKELVVLDLKTPGYPCVEPPHALDLHDSPVTCLEFYLDTNSTLLPTLCEIAATKPQCKDIFKKEWPLGGGECNLDEYEGIPELVVSGHADGSVRFWDATAGNLKPIYKLRTYKIFHRSSRESSTTEEEDEAYRITNIALCPHTQTLVTANISSTLIIYKLHSSEIHTEICTLSINVMDEIGMLVPPAPDHNHVSNLVGLHGEASSNEDLTQSSSYYTVTAPSATTATTTGENENHIVQKSRLRSKSGNFRQSPGFQSNFICMFTDDGTISPISIFISLSTSNNLISVGTIVSLCVIDITQKTCLFNMNTNNILMSIDGKMHSSSKLKLQGLTDTSPSSLSTDHSFSKSQLEKEDSLNSDSAPSAMPSKSKRYIKISKKNTSLSLEKSIGSMESSDDHMLSRASSSTESDHGRSNEGVTYLCFSCTTIKKHSNTTVPCMWVGTQSGCLFSIIFNQTSHENRASNRVTSSLSGTLLQLHGAIVSCIFINLTGQVVTDHMYTWTTQTSVEEKDHVNDHDGEISRDIHFMMVTSERQVKIFTLPSLSCVHVFELPIECGQFIHSSVDTLMNGTCAACYTSSGHIVVLGLPSLNLLLNVPYLPPNDDRIAHTFSFTSDGQAMFLPNPTELQRIAYYVGIHENVQEMVGHLFVPCEDIEKPATGFLKGLFGGGYTSIDRENLFGEGVNGKTKAIARYIPGTGGSSFEGFRHGNVGSEFHQLKNKVLERGQRLGELEEKSQKLVDSASRFAAVSNEVMHKYKNKRWYQM
ncbi:syntaxin-binding protein 5-like isoform X2 [Ciona intestinalis]